jgi:hypothetical protein
LGVVISGVQTPPAPSPVPEPPAFAVRSAPVEPEPASVQPQEPAGDVVVELPGPRRPDPPAPTTVAQLPNDSDTIPVPPPADEVLTSGNRAKVQAVQVVASRFSVPMALRSLTTADGVSRFRAELEKDATHRVEAFCREPWRGVERLQTVCRARGIGRQMDPAAQEGVRRKVRQNYVLFSDDLTADQWAQLLRQVAAVDQKAEEREAGDGVYDQLVVTPFIGADRKDLTAIFGIDPSQPAAPGGPAAGQPSAKGAQRLAVLAAYQPSRGSIVVSKEVKHFLDRRDARRPGQVGVMLVIRTPG